MSETRSLPSKPTVSTREKRQVGKGHGQSGKAVTGTRNGKQRDGQVDQRTHLAEGRTFTTEYEEAASWRVSVGNVESVGQGIELCPLATGGVFELRRRIDERYSSTDRSRGHRGAWEKEAAGEPRDQKGFCTKENPCVSTPASQGLIKARFFGERSKQRNMVFLLHLFHGEATVTDNFWKRKETAPIRLWVVLRGEGNILPEAQQGHVFYWGS